MVAVNFAVMTDDDGTDYIKTSEFIGFLRALAGTVGDKPIDGNSLTKIANSLEDLWNAQQTEGSIGLR